MALAKVFESKKAAYLLHKEAAKQSKAGAKAASRTVNQQAYWNHVSKYLKDHQGGRGGIKAAADSWANPGSASDAEKTAKGKAAKAKAKKAKAEPKSAKATKAKASAAKQQEPNAKQRRLGVTTTIQDKEKAKKAQKKFTAKEKADKEKADKAKADKVWTAFRASGTK